MDFSSLLSKEIEKKRKVAGESKRNKRAKAEDVVTEQGKEEAVDEGRAVEGDGATEEEVEPGGSKYTPEEKALVESVSHEQLDAKLEQLNDVCEPGATKLDKIRRVEVLVRLQRKKETYRRQLDKENAADTTIRLEDIASDARDKLHTQVRVYVKKLVKQWEEDVQLTAAAVAQLGGDERDDGDEAVLSQAAVLLDTKKDLVALLYKLRTDGLTLPMLTSLCTIMYYLQVHDYRRANESYMKLSIGNVAWPIGVKGVGIHERSAALKITGENKLASANIMLDDKTRRWITAIKRLISFAERRWPT